MYLLQGFHFDWEKQGYLVERTQTLRKKKKTALLRCILFIYIFIHLFGRRERAHTRVRGRGPEGEGQADSPLRGDPCKARSLRL